MATKLWINKDAIDMIRAISLSKINPQTEIRLRCGANVILSTQYEKVLTDFGITEYFDFTDTPADGPT